MQFHAARNQAMQFHAARNQTNQWRHRNETVTVITPQRSQITRLRELPTGIGVERGEPWRPGC